METQSWNCMERDHGYTRVMRHSSSLGSLKSSENLPYRSRDRCGTCSVCISAPPGCLLAEPSKCLVSPVLHRLTTPPLEESSSSSDNSVAKRTVQTLCRILDDQTSPQPIANDPANHGALSSSTHHPRLRAPHFLPRSPAPITEAGTSTATASISRFLTKGAHSSSTRPPSPPRQSAMKRSPISSVSPSPSLTHPDPIVNTPMALSFLDVAAKDLVGGSTPSSGMSTPSKRISFAELPESYASTRPNGGSSFKLKDKYNRRKRSNEGGEKEESSPERPGSMSKESSAHDSTMTLSHQEERMTEWTSTDWGWRVGAGVSSDLDIWS